MAERLPQGIALRRSGRARIEKKQLAARSRAIADAAVRREWLAGGIRALPDAGSGLAAALCLWTCMRLGLGVPDAVAALTALAMIVRPLRHLADVTDRRRAYLVASDKLDRMLATPRMPRLAREDVPRDAPAIRAISVEMPALAPLDLLLGRGALRRLSGPPGSGKSAFLTALAGLDMPPDAVCFEVLGAAPGAAPTGQVLYLGSQALRLRGSLRREVTIGIGRNPDDAEIAHALGRAGLSDLLTRLGGPEGRVAEGRRNLTASEGARLHLARALLSQPALALVDADEIGLDRAALGLLVDHLEDVEVAALIVTSNPEAVLRLGPPIELASKARLRSGTS
jgi:ABC-type transport system involved in cytochrome bd biosynthesis fused ATPase/permease subunit